jgi:hypothetical protein
MEKSIIWVIILFLVCIVGFFAYSGVETWYKMRLETALEQERKQCRDKVNDLDQQVATLKEMVALSQQAPEVKEKIADVLGDDVAATTSNPPLRTLTCGDMKRQLSSLMVYLDGKEYRELYGFKQDFEHLFRETVDALNEKMPVITGEMDDLRTLIQNVTHFYRAVGRKKVGLIADILKNESEMMEPVMLMIYNWATAEGRCNNLDIQPLNLETLYQYSGFFLNTLGGRSYLLRRDSKVRVLASYYSILILDQANEKTMNPYGIDIRPYIDISFYDIRSHQGLMYQKAYLAKLKELKNKYQM